MSGSGMSFYYEPSPAAKARAAALQQEEQERRLAEERRKQQVQDSLREVQQARERAEQQAELQRQREARQQARKLHPLLAVKTDAVFWAGVMPGFERGTYTPNLAAELFFLPVGGLSSWVEVMLHWDAIWGDYGLFNTSALDLELRSWVGDEGSFPGIFPGIVRVLWRLRRSGRFGSQRPDGDFLRGWSRGLKLISAIGVRGRCGPGTDRSRTNFTI